MVCSGTLFPSSSFCDAVLVAAIGFPLTTSIALILTHRQSSSRVILLKVSQEGLKRHNVLNTMLFAKISLFISPSLAFLVVLTFLSG